VRRAASDLEQDIERITGIRPVVADTLPAKTADVVVVGTLGSRRLVDGLVAANRRLALVLVGGRARAPG
jgi:hypothetical protein